MKSDSILTCPLCSENAVLKREDFPGYQEPDTFGIYHCPGCETAFSHPKVNTSALYEHIYRNGERVPGYGRYWTYALDVRRLSDPLQYLCDKEDTYWSVREALSKIVKDKQSAKIAEVGSGLGYLTYSLNKSGYHVTGLDVSRTAVENATLNFGNYFVCDDIKDFAKLNSEKYDIVIMTEVIEHIEDPVGFLNIVKSLLKTGGSIIVTTPNRSFFSDDIIWATELPPVHLWWFSEKTLLYIAAKIKMSAYMVDFSEYFKSRFNAVNMNTLNDRKLYKPFLDADGKLILQNTDQATNHLSVLNSLLSPIPVLKKNLIKIRSFFNRRIPFCDKRGTTLTVILTCTE